MLDGSLVGLLEDIQIFFRCFHWFYDFVIILSRALSISIYNLQYISKSLFNWKSLCQSCLINLHIVGFQSCFRNFSVIFATRFTFQHDCMIVFQIWFCIRLFATRFILIATQVRHICDPINCIIYEPSYELWTTSCPLCIMMHALCKVHGEPVTVSS